MSKQEQSPDPRLLDLFRRMKGDNLRGDIFGGLTAGIVALPLALGFGVASGLDNLVVDGVHLNGALAGLIGAICVGIIAAIFGGTPSQVSGPTGPMTVVVAGMVAASTGDPRWLFVAFVLAGAMQIALGLLKVGRYVNYIPYPVISGFMSGIGVIIIMLQLPQLFGAPAIGSPMKALASIPSALQSFHAPAFLLAAATIALVYLVPRVTKAVPGTLVALIAVTAVSWLMGLDVTRLGTIPSGRPELQLPAAMDLSAMWAIIVPAFTLAVLASIDSLLTSLVADQVTRTKHNSERELIGQGLGNMVAGMFGGLPGAGATMRTVINVRSGGRGRLSGVVHGLFLVAVLLGLGPLAAQIPHAVLAGILVTVGIGIIDYKGLKHLIKVPRADASVMIVVLALTVAVDLMTAVAVGMIMASVLLVKRLSDADPATHTPLAEMASTRPPLADTVVPDALVEGIHVARLQGSLFFGNAGPLRRRLSHLFDEHGVVLDLRRVTFIDQSGAYALAELIDELKHQGRETCVVLAGMKEEPAATLRELGVAPGNVPKAHIVGDVKTAIEVAVAESERVEKRAADDARAKADEDAELALAAAAS